MKSPKVVPQSLVLPAVGLKCSSLWLHISSTFADGHSLLCFSFPGVKVLSGDRLGIPADDFASVRIINGTVTRWLLCGY